MDKGQLVELTADIGALKWKAGMRFRITQLHGETSPFIVADVKREGTNETLSNVALPLFRKVEE